MNYTRFQYRRYQPECHFFTDHRPRIFGFQVRHKARCLWQYQTIERSKFNPVYGVHRWVNREWPDDWRPFHTRVQTVARKREDWIYKMQLRALT